MKCSFCHRDDEPYMLRGLQGRWPVQICARCLKEGKKVADLVSTDDFEKFWECSFCDESQARGQYTTDVFVARICDACVRRCLDLLAGNPALPVARVIKTRD